jgi:hypothetical protein
VGFVNYKKGALDSQPQVIKFTSCLPIVGGSPDISSKSWMAPNDITISILTEYVRFILGLIYRDMLVISKWRCSISSNTAHSDCIIMRYTYKILFSQLKSLFEIFTFVIERNIKYQYLILTSLILVVSIEIVLVFLIQYIKDRSINSIRILRVISWLFLILVYLFTSDIYFRFDPRVGRYEKSKMFWVFFGIINIIYGIISSTEIK